MTGRVSLVGLGDFELLRVVSITGDGGQGLIGYSDGLHVLVEQRNVELALLDGDFAVQGFVLAELQDAAAVGAEFDTAMAKGKGNAEGEDEGDEFGLHVCVCLVVCLVTDRLEPPAEGTCAAALRPMSKKSAGVTARSSSVEETSPPQMATATG